MNIKQILSELHNYNNLLDEDINKIKDRIDQNIKSGADVDKIDGDINYMAKTNNEKEEAQKYATQKMLQK